MIRKGLIYLATTLMILLLVSLAMALVPPPPANQNIGLYDTVFTGFTTEECKNEACHGDEIIPDRHHLLIEKEGKKCLECHKVTDGDIGPFDECSYCHLSSPHHATDDAKYYNCSECHGSLVDDRYDGHEISDSAPNMITPDSSFKYINNTSGLKIGGCEACHEPDPDAVPAIESNPNTHHNLTHFSENNCALCHVNDATGGVSLDIKLCEICHGVKSLHSIQYDSINTTGDNASLGYGHIGDDWDCWGCHGWKELDIFSASSLSDQLVASSTSEGDTFPFQLSSDFGPTYPSIDTIDPCEIRAGKNTTMRVYGSNFINTRNGVTYTSNVTLDNDFVIEPDSITTTEIVVTIPWTLGSGNYDVRAEKVGDIRSNKVSLTVSSEEPLFVVVHRKI